MLCVMRTSLRENDEFGRSVRACSPASSCGKGGALLLGGGIIAFSSARARAKSLLHLSSNSYPVQSIFTLFTAAVGTPFEFTVK